MKHKLGINWRNQELGITNKGRWLRLIFQSIIPASLFLILALAAPQAQAVGGCCQVACPDASVVCADSTNLSTCGTGLLATCPGGGGSPNPVPNTACNTIMSCPQYQPPPPPVIPGCVTGTQCPAGQVQGFGACPGPGQITCVPAPTTAPTTAPPAAGGGGATGVRGVALPNPLGTTSAPVILGRIIRTLTGFAGGIALLVFIYGGMLWLTSAGNPEKIKKGRDLIVWAALGMAVMFGSYIIVRYILVAFTRGVVTP